MVSRQWRLVPAAGLVAVLLLAVAVVVRCTAERADGPAATGVSAPAGASTPRSDLPTVAVADLPQPARDTLALVDGGGPFPYRQDGTTFNNFEGRLPVRPGGYYREYTVPTPGSRDRGARRLVVGHDGDVFYTDDHYETFRQVVR